MHQSEARIDTHGLLRELGLKEAIAIGLGTMIGAGIFVLSALAAERAGPAAALSYVLAGAICLPIALVVSELATGCPGLAEVIPSSPRRWIRWLTVLRAV
jgi:amino acid transporter